MKSCIFRWMTKFRAYEAVNNLNAKTSARRSSATFRGASAPAWHKRTATSSTCCTEKPSCSQRQRQRPSVMCYVSCVILMCSVSPVCLMCYTFKAVYSPREQKIQFCNCCFNGFLIDCCRFWTSLGKSVSNAQCSTY